MTDNNPTSSHVRIEIDPLSNNNQNDARENNSTGFHRYTQGSDEVVSAPHDYLMLACKLDDIAWLKDVQPDEKAIFDDIHNYELTTTLVSIPANPANKIPQSPHMFLAGKLTSAKYLNK